MRVFDPRSGRECETVGQVISRCCMGRLCDDCPLDCCKTGVSCISLRYSDDLFGVAMMAMFEIEDDPTETDIKTDDIMTLIGSDGFGGVL